MLLIGISFNILKGTDWYFTNTDIKNTATDKPESFLLIIRAEKKVKLICLLLCILVRH